MEISTSNNDNAIILDVSGDVNIQSAPALRSAIQQQVGKGAKRVVVRLAEVNYMDSSGVGVLVSGLKLARDKKVPFCLVEVSRNVMDVIEVTRLTKIFNIYTDLSTALEQLN
ncbi:STAS domain-containing protein [Planctomycetota bacterium]